MDTLNHISALCDNISKQIAEENTLNTYEEGEICEEKDNLMINFSDEEEKSEMYVLDSTPLDHIVEHECIAQYNDDVIYKKDKDILSFSFKDIEKRSEVSDSNFIQDLYYYFKDDIIPHWLDDKYDNGDDIIFLDGVNLFDEETKDTSIEDVTPNPIIHKTLDTMIEDESDSHDYDLDQSIEKGVEEPPIMLSTTHFTSKKFIHDEPTIG